MREYLDKQKLLMALNDKYHDMSGMPASYYAGFQYAIKLIERFNVSEEVAPVRHGRWKLCYEDDRHQYYVRDRAIEDWNTRPAPPIGMCKDCLWYLPKSKRCKYSLGGLWGEVNELSFCSCFKPKEE